MTVSDEARTPVLRTSTLDTPSRGELLADTLIVCRKD
jgi:hypothetical protein